MTNTSNKKQSTLTTTVQMENFPKQVLIIECKHIDLGNKRNKFNLKSISNISKRNQNKKSLRQ